MDDGMIASGIADGVVGPGVIESRDRALGQHIVFGLTRLTESRIDGSTALGIFFSRLPLGEGEEIDIVRAGRRAAGGIGGRFPRHRKRLGVGGETATGAPVEIVLEVLEFIVIASTGVSATFNY